jgi:hypothetical protein
MEDVKVLFDLTNNWFDGKSYVTALESEPDNTCVPARRLVTVAQPAATVTC